MSESAPVNCGHGKWNSYDALCRCDKDWVTDPNQDILGHNFTYCNRDTTVRDDWTPPPAVAGQAHARGFNINSAVFFLGLALILFLCGAAVCCYRCFCRHRRHRRRDAPERYVSPAHGSNHAVRDLTNALRSHGTTLQQQHQVLSQPIGVPAIMPPPPPRAAVRPMTIMDRPAWQGDAVGAGYYTGNYLPHDLGAYHLQYTEPVTPRFGQVPPPPARAQVEYRARTPVLRRVREPRATHEVVVREPYYSTDEVEEREPAYIVTVTPPLSRKETRTARHRDTLQG